MSLHDKAKDGSLNRRDLRAQPAGFDIDESDTARGWSPLAYAVANGHLNVIRTLQTKGASLRRKTSGPDHSTLLHIAVTSKGPNALAVVKYLIEKNGQNIDEPAGIPPNDTPLMTAIRQGAEPAIIKLLKDSGASTRAKNSNGETAEDIANSNSNTKTKDAIRPKDDRDTGKTELSDFIAAAVRLGLVYLKPWQNTRDAAVDAIKQLGRELGKTPSELKKLPADFMPKTLQDFKDLIRELVEEMGIEDMVPKGSDLEDDIAEKGVDNVGNPDLKDKSPSEIRDLVRCALYQPIIYFDDSGSMKGERMDAATAIVERVATLMSVYAPEDKGCHIRFINRDADNLDNLDGPTMGERLDFTPDGWTPLGTSLRKKILDPFVYGPLNANEDFDRPILVITISDGAPNQEAKELFQNEIRDCGSSSARGGYAHDNVKFLVTQVGDDGEAKAFLDGLKQLAQQPSHQDILHITSDRLDGPQYQQLRQNRKELDAWLIKTLGPQVKPQP